MKDYIVIHGNPTPKHNYCPALYYKTESGNYDVANCEIGHCDVQRDADTVLMFISDLIKDGFNVSQFDSESRAAELLRECEKEYKSRVR